MSKNLSDQPFSPVPLDGAAEFLRGCYPKARRFLMVGQEEHRAEAAVDANACLIDPLIVHSSPDPLFGTESIGSAHASRSLLAADGQTLPALGAAALQHETAILGGHTDQEPVRLAAPACIRLKSALALHDFSPCRGRQGQRNARPGRTGLVDRQPQQKRCATCGHL